MDAVLGLLKGYGLSDPARETVPGQFSDPHLHELYQSLIKTGRL